MIIKQGLAGDGNQTQWLDGPLLEILEQRPNRSMSANHVILGKSVLRS